MQKLLYFFCFIGFGSLQIIAQNSNPITPTEISIITIGPGTALNDAFGHNAINVKTPFSNIVYDYGRYDFDDPNFYTNFARGKLKYLQGKSTYFDMISFYKRQNRTIKQQVLNLTDSEKIAINNYLINNYKPENRAYLYDFFYDNCATKIRDITEIITHENLVFNTPKSFTQKTFRELIRDNVHWNTWGGFGIDIALGSVIDIDARPKEYMFLPQYIHEFFEEASFENSNEKLVKSSKTIHTQIKTQKNKAAFLTSPLFIFSILSLIMIFITYKDYKNGKRTIILDVLGFFITGLIGILILLLWFATDHSTTAVNYNLLWAFALNILFVYKISKKEVSQRFIKYLKFLIIMLCLLIFHWVIGVQKFAITLAPLLIAITIRYVFLISFFNKTSIAKQH